MLGLGLLLAACNPAAPPPSATAQREDPDLGPYSVHLLANKTEMEMSGDMNVGVTAAVRQLLDANPGIQVIHLNSPGGEAHEGYLLSVLIKQRHLATYTATVCASACTEAFLAGAPRYLAKGAKLGFHSAAHAAGGTPWNGVNDALRHFYQEAGLPDDFIDHALRTAPSDIWFPTDDELRAAHVVDQMVDRSKFAASGAS